jgi:hypothetical protein
MTQALYAHMNNKTNKQKKGKLKSACLIMTGGLANNPKKTYFSFEGTGTCFETKRQQRHSKIKISKIRKDPIFPYSC